MFFIMGITDGRKDFDFLQAILCNVCGRYGQYRVFMTYTVLSLFFIPCFKWNKHYYVQTSCCDTVYELDPEVGKRITRGENVEIRPEDLTCTGAGGYGYISLIGKTAAQNNYIHRIVPPKTKLI